MPDLNGWYDDSPVIAYWKTRKDAITCHADSSVLREICASMAEVVMETGRTAQASYKGESVDGLHLVNEFDKHVYQSTNTANEDHKWFAAARGMTKREMMAMNAPDEVPSWFESMWQDRNSGNREYFCDSLVGGDFAFDTTTTTITQRGLEACYFSWRAYYADKMLAELELQHAK